MNFTLANKETLDFTKYKELYEESIKSPDDFWRRESKRLAWFKEPTKIKNAHFSKDSAEIQWFEDGVLNVCFNCLDRHLEARGDKVAIIWEGDDASDVATLTYNQLHELVCRFANGLKSLGLTKGDRVIIYMPMILESAVAMLACARIGVVHSVVFGGFAAESLANRIQDCQPKVIISADVVQRGGKDVYFKQNVDAAKTLCKDMQIESVVVHKKADMQSKDPSDLDFYSLINASSADSPCEQMAAEDPLFILYTSGSTGKPKGVVHTTGGYLVYASMTHEYIFNLQEDDVYWCTADIGWITGHSYVIYGPLCNGATTLMFSGTPSYPAYSRYWEIIDKYKVNIFYTAPTAIRMLRSQGNERLKSTSRSTLRILGSVGEPIDPTAWDWYYREVGHSQAFLTDTWWQTETGGIMIAPIKGVAEPIPGYAMLPFFGVKPALMTSDREIVHGEGSGNLVIEASWPGQARTLFNAHARFIETYFSAYDGKYFSGDGAERDANGYYKITGRIDDVLNVSGHRISTAEIEGALTQNENVAEAAVVGFPHDIKGEGIYAYVVLYHHSRAVDGLKAELIEYVKNQIGHIVVLDKIQWVEALPKTRSGKVMRRILRKIASGDINNLGDLSTLENPSIVEALINNRL